MPSDVVTIVVSTGIGVSVIAGVLSGVCYILAHGFTRKRSRRSLLQWYCAVCGSYLRSRLVDNVKAVICLECEERVCKLRCAKREYVRKGWICYNCLKQPSFFKGILNTIRLRYKGFKELTYKDSNITQLKDMEKDIDDIRKREKDHIRDFIEKLVSTILGGNVDDASVFRIYNDKYYDTLFERYHQDLSNAITDLSSSLHISITNAPVDEQSPSTAHTNLKRIIEKLLGEASRFPNFHRAVEAVESSPTENERTYEELLATAILNKIISKFQRRRSSSAASVSSKISTSSKNKDNKEYFFGEETLETKWNPTDLETTSNSSLDDYLHSDSSHGSAKYVDRVSLTIRQHIEETIPTIIDEDVDEDVTDNFNSFSDRSLLNDNDSNWYLQKRQFHGSHSPVPVPMLVPNPVNTAKVLIGDKEVEETSDLSDAASDYDNVESTGIQSYMIESKMIIGGQNVISRIETNDSSDEETSADSGVREDRDDLSEKDKNFTSKPKADISVDDENVEDVSLASLNSNIEKDTEYFEKYASLPRTILKSPSPTRRSQKSLIRQFSTSVEEDDKVLKIQDTEENLETTTVPEGSYSKKEKEKWKNPIEMPNNPYSKENIEKRIRSSQIFDKDFYIKEATIPSGKIKDHEEDVNMNQSGNELNIFRAIPVTVENDEPYEPDQESIKKDNETFELPEVTSDSDLSLVNCYDVENSKIYYHSSDNDQNEITIKKIVNTEELIYIPQDVQQKPPQSQQILEIKDFILPEPKITHNHVNSDLKQENITVHTVNNENIEIPKIIPRSFTNKTEPRSKISSIAQFALQENNSSENNLANTDKPPIASRKLDNTLIKKIYSDPVVKSFTLINREQRVTSDENAKLTPNFENSNFEQDPSNILIPDINSDSLSENSKYEDQFHSLQELNSDNNNNQTFSLEFSDSDSIEKENSLYKNDFNVLKKKGLVSDRISALSNSFPNLSEINFRNENTDQSQTKLPPETFVSVKDLRRLFENNDASCYKDKPVHSLTARSISKQMKQKLKNHSDDMQ